MERDDDIYIYNYSCNDSHCRSLQNAGSPRCKEFPQDATQLQLFQLSNYIA